jgi:D-glycero-alpha-D-manno-heptose-7-phosphate kinase
VEKLQGREPSTPAARVRLARDLEARLMKLPTGIQDHYPGQFGGALEIRMAPGGEVVRRLGVDLEALGESLLVVYSGVSHFSAGQNWQVVRRRLDGERESVELFSGIAEAAAELSGALEAGDFPRVGALMAHEWSFRRRLAEGVSTPELERLLAAARERGAWGGKACGAGGGGCLAILCPPERRADVAAALTAAGGQVLRARPTGEPLAVTAD